MIPGTTQLAKFLRNIKKIVGKLTNNRAYGHYREMAGLPFQKERNIKIIPDEWRQAWSRHGAEEGLHGASNQNGRFETEDASGRSSSKHFEYSGDLNKGNI